ncbi:MAG: YitT family protein [Clostridia bacterium]|nr:YitT family protein [Clostridia bacterium]
MERIWAKHIIDALYIIIGCVLLSFAITVILKPNHLITGGITGFSIVVEKFIGIPYTIIYYGMSLLVLMFTYLMLGKEEVKKIVILSLVLPAFLISFEHLFSGKFNFTDGDMFLSSIYYGIIAGAGAGFFLKRGFSSGGTDTIAKVLHIKVFPFMSISQLVAVLDITVIVLSIVVFNLQTALYAIVTQVVFIKSMEVILYGFGNNLLKLEIISDKEEAIEDFILNDIHRGITKYNIVGAYSNLERIKLVTVCSRRESMLIRQKIAKVDQNAFVTVTAIASVWGMGVGFDNLLLNE